MSNKKQTKIRGAPAAGKVPQDTPLVERLAILGDSFWALLGSFAILVAAILVSWNLHTNDNSYERPQQQQHHVTAESPNYEDLYQHLEPLPPIDPPRVYSIQEEENVIHLIHEAYHKDGVVAIRGLIPETLLDRLDLESTQLIREKGPKRKRLQKQTQFHTMVNGAAFLNPPTVTTTDDDEGLPAKIENRTAFLEVALMSQVPQMASQLMLPELQEGETVRMMRDIFLTRKSDQDFACGYHVDDTGFWPATAASPGINAWIALDDMPAVSGGGFALAVGSHKASWREKAHYITGATTFFPPNGFTSAADMFANRTGSGTCNIQSSAPHLYRRMEETKRIYNLQKGDVIFHQRFLFHRTVPFEKEFTSQMDQDLLYRRYSVRYSPGSAIVPPGYGTELSVLWNEGNGNRSADQVSEVDGPWYPRVWPDVSKKELQSLKSLVTDKMTIAEKRKDLRKKEMQPFLKQAASKHSNGGHR